MTEYKYPIKASDTVVGEKYACERADERLYKRLAAKGWGRVNFHPFAHGNDVVMISHKDILYSATDPSIITAGELEVGEWCLVLCKAKWGPCQQIKCGDQYHPDLWCPEKADIVHASNHDRVRRLPAPVWPEPDTPTVEEMGDVVLSWQVEHDHVKQQRDALVDAIHDKDLKRKALIAWDFGKNQAGKDEYRDWWLTEYGKTILSQAGSRKRGR